jgi:hypothetical protein
VQCLQLILTMSNADQKLADRFYRSLYELLFTLTSVNVTNLDDFFSLLYKALKNDS